MSGHRLEFQAPEYHGDGSFRMASYAFEREGSSAWNVYREGVLQEELGEGFAPVQPVFCGVCATDLARRHLPFPLPQILGHEVVGRCEGQPVVVEINASHVARGLDTADCPRCREGLPSHCPDRLTLGINRLPGGFAPQMLAPVRGIIPVPEGRSTRAAVLVEPLSAALHAVERTPPAEGEEVAVLGPRRLGLLLISALDRFRKRTGRRFGVTAILRHARLSRLCRDLGADRVVHTTPGMDQPLHRAFETVFDTSGTPEGFSLALRLARRRVHLKSTHGRPAMGISRLTDMVVEEVRLVSWRGALSTGLSLPLAGSTSGDSTLYLSGSVPEVIRTEIARLTQARCITDPRGEGEGGRVPEVHAAVVTRLHEIDRVLESRHGSGIRVRPGGSIIFAGLAPGRRPGALEEALSRGIEIHTSRCGSFMRGIEVLSEDPELGRILEKRLITHTFPLERIGEAFDVASDSRSSIKVLVASRP